MSIFKKTPATPSNITTHKSISGTYTVDHAEHTISRTAPTGWDAEGTVTIPAEWIDHVEQRRNAVAVHLINHGSFPQPQFGGEQDMWLLYTSSKKNAATLADDITNTIHAAAGRDLRPFIVPQPVDKQTEKVAAQMKKDYPTAIIFGTMMLLDGVVYYAGHAIDAKTATATIDTGMAAQSKVGAGRVIGGAILAGPAGAIIGAAAKKNIGEIFVTVTSEDGQVLMASAPTKQSSAATALVNAVGAA